MLKRIIFTIITISWMILIFNFSNQKATISTNVSNSFIDKTIIKVYKIIDDDLTVDKEENIRKNFFVPIRKIAHLTVYLILGILVFITLKEYNVKEDIIYYTILICFLYSISDEIHQLFILGRSGEFKDVLIDTLGSTIGVFIIKKITKFNTVQTT